MNTCIQVIQMVQVRYLLQCMSVYCVQKMYTIFSEMPLYMSNVQGQMQLEKVWGALHPPNREIQPGTLSLPLDLPVMYQPVIDVIMIYIDPPILSMEV